jgi:mono/diheme cytochrome c family protein
MAKPSKSGREVAIHRAFAATVGLGAVNLWVLTATLPAGSAAAAADPVGKGLYERAGCIACHGPDARGTDLAPMLAGHTAEQVKRYARNPQGKMPRFGPDKLSDSELDAVAAYIAGIAVPEARVEALELSAALEMHHWIAHHALAANDAKHASVHLAHILELVKDDDAHRRGIERIAGLVRANRLTPAAQELLQMLHAKVTPDISVEKMHLRLALGAIDAGDMLGARHYLEQYVEGASPHDRKHAAELLVLLKKGDLVAVKKRVAHLLGD